VAEGGSDVRDIYHAGLGVVLTEGKLMESYVEFGYGRNDVFVDQRPRFKVDAFLSMPGPKGVSPFAQVVIDADFGDRGDSIQSFFGLDIDIFEAWSSAPSTS
jgi:hypothetical protein|tara:strand:- start:23 stop:328 length:306 start_codon:yes stop_codon:yes gene_type:complete